MKLHDRNMEAVVISDNEFKCPRDHIYAGHPFMSRGRVKSLVIRVVNVVRFDACIYFRIPQTNRNVAT